MRRNLLITALCLAVVAVCVPALAEVRIVSDRDGEYNLTRVVPDRRSADVWSPTGRGDSRRSLNLYGDRNGDLWPTITESNSASHNPWVVWSRLNQGQYDLAYTYWSGSRWEPVGWLTSQETVVGDDLDVDMAFDSSGRPYVVWWRNEEGVGRVYVSVFLETRWLHPFQVSPGGVDSRYPTIEVLDQNHMAVWFETSDDGVVEQIVKFSSTVAITDDINPLDFVFPHGIPTVVTD